MTYECFLYESTIILFLCFALFLALWRLLNVLDEFFKKIVDFIKSSDWQEK